MAFLTPLLALRPFFRFRVLFYRSERLGHQVGDIEIFLRKRAKPETPEDSYFTIFITRNPSNYFLHRMIKRYVPVINSRILARGLEFLLKRFGSLPIIGRLPAITFQDVYLHKPAHFYKNEENLMNARYAGPQILLNNSDHARGEKLLKQMGLPEGMPYVCIHQRDSAYLKKRDPSLNYHDYRDVSIDSYRLMIEYLREQGFAVIRVGSIVEQQLESNDPFVIDYSSRYRTEFGDIYLNKTCDLFVGNGSGIWCLPLAEGRPIALVDSSPIGIAPFTEEDIFTPKLYRKKDENRLMSIPEIISMKAELFGFDSQFEDAGIELVNNTAEEIRDLVTERVESLKGTLSYSQEDNRLQQKFWDLWPKGHPMSRYPSRIGRAFIKKYQNLLDP